MLPEEGIDRASYSRTERISVATLSLVAAKTLQLVSLDKSTHKVVIVDEAWFLFSTPARAGLAEPADAVRARLQRHHSVADAAPRGPGPAAGAGPDVVPVRPRRRGPDQAATADGRRRADRRSRAPLSRTGTPAAASCATCVGASRRFKSTCRPTSCWGSSTPRPVPRRSRHETAPGPDPRLAP